MRITPLCVLAVTACLAGSAPFAAAAPNAATAKKRCKLVTIRVHGHKQRLRVCHKVKPHSGKPATKPAPPPPPPPPGASTSNPVSLGSEAQIDEGWRLKVLSADPNQTDAIVQYQRGDPDNLTLPPQPGYQYLLAHVTVTRTDSDPASFSPYSLVLLTAGGDVIDTPCGALADPLSAVDLASGGAATGDVCWELKTSDVQGLEATYTDPFTGADTYFALGL